YIPTAKGKTTFPAPKNMENMARPTDSDCDLNNLFITNFPVSKKYIYINKRLNKNLTALKL
ncbi:MAG: hypothetical protein COT84_03200, partial [Chlamydiae bacterium CG10_big_fil_rev_8_21_14_0_10_35_9]